MTNKDVVEGKLKQAEGRVEDAYGDLTHNHGHDINGKAKQAEGAAQEGLGHVKQAIADAVKRNEANEELETAKL
jgi:uncharacterized protein YjbJ (UPF0337 family)